jgi:hypothetical protein
MCLRYDIGREEKSVPLNSSNEFLVFATFANGTPRGIDSTVQSCIGYYSSLPDMLDKLAFTDHAVRILCEVNKQVEYLRLHVDRPLGATKLAPIAIKREVTEI